MSIEDFLARAAAERPEAPALSSLHRTWTYRALSAQVDGRADELRAEGVRPGRLVSRVLESTPEGIVELLALWRLGATPAPLNPSLTRHERVAAERALGGAEGDARQARKRLGVEPGGAPATGSSVLAQAVLWTSGTEGSPRGVALSADNLRASAEAARDRLDLDADDCWLASLSLAHVGGLALVVRSLLLGGRVVAVGRFDAALVSDLVDGKSPVPGPGSGAPTQLSLVPTQLLRVLDHRGGRPPPPTLRCVLLGGAHTPDDLLARALDEGWPIALTYGMTEMTSQVATAPPALVRDKPGTVGPPLEGVEIRIGTDGEILARGPTRALRYVASVEGLMDADGWYQTGDLGRLDAEGHLWVTGRASERIVSGGVTVDPQEVEEALRGHPDVADACVVGLLDAEWGERVAAALVPAGAELDLDEVGAWACERLAPAKRPRRWAVMDELPRNANGKVSRPAVRAALADAERAHPTP